MRGTARTVEGDAELGGVLLELVEGPGAEGVGADLFFGVGSFVRLCGEVCVGVGWWVHACVWP